MKTKIITAALVIAVSALSFNVNAQSRDSGSRRSDNSAASYRSGSANSSPRNSASVGISTRGGRSNANAVSSDRRSTASSSGSSYRAGGSASSYRNGGGSGARENHSVVAGNASRHDNHMPTYKSRKYKGFDRDRSHVVVRHYPRHIVDVRDHVLVRHAGVDYYYRNGLYYHWVADRYVVAPAPRHIRVSVIPDNYFAFRIGSLAYYYAAGAYYNYDPVTLTYEAVEPPMGAVVPELPDYDVNTVVVNGKTYLEYDGVLYKAIVSDDGVRYKVMGRLDNY